MRLPAVTLAAAVLAAALAGSWTGAAAVGTPTTDAGRSSGAAGGAPRGGDAPLPGVELANTLALATGIAISPLLGVSAVGAWQVWRTPPELRPSLPWYASAWFWIPGLAVGLLLALKDPVLGIAPGAKKPLDALDVLENKVSALLAAPAVVPMFLSAVAGVRRVGELAAGSSPAVALAGVAALPGWVEELPRALLVGLGLALFLAAFFCVWLAFHAINVLILLSPFGPLDTLLRLVKLAVLAVLGAATLIHPYLGLLVALGIVAVSVLLAGWSFRLMVFGGVLAGDLVTWRHRRVKTDPSRLRAFVVDELGSAPARTYGRVWVGDTGLRFTYRPWLVLRRRTLELPAGDYRLGSGLVCPSVRLLDDDGDSIAVLRLPPRYRYHEQELVAALGLGGLEELPLRRGLRAAIRWLREMGRRGGRAAARLAGRVGEELG